MAHMRKKRQTPGNESLDGNVFKGIEQANRGKSEKHLKFNSMAFVDL